jgi:uncharacterized protein DUF4325
MIIKMSECCGNYAENKDIAKDLRQKEILPVLESKRKRIILDFDGVDSTTQSFIHALISEGFQKYGEKALNKIEFKNCNKAVKSLVTTVINYSLE